MTPALTHPKNNMKLFEFLMNVIRKKILYIQHIHTWNTKQNIFLRSRYPFKQFPKINNIRKKTTLHHFFSNTIYVY
jgi:hypothetical protein